MESPFQTTAKQQKVKFSGKIKSCLKEVIRNNFTNVREDSPGHLQHIRNTQELLLYNFYYAIIQIFVLNLSQTLLRLNSIKVQVYSPSWKNNHVPHTSYDVFHISNWGGTIMNHISCFIKVMKPIKFKAFQNETK